MEQSCQILVPVQLPALGWWFQKLPTWKQYRSSSIEGAYVVHQTKPPPHVRDGFWHRKVPYGVNRLCCWSYCSITNLESHVLDCLLAKHNLLRIHHNAITRTQRQILAAMSEDTIPSASHVSYDNRLVLAVLQM